MYNDEKCVRPTDDIKFGKNVKHIGRHAFEICAYYNGGLVICLPDSVEVIGDWAFMGCRIDRWLSRNLQYI